MVILSSITFLIGLLLHMNIGMLTSFVQKITLPKCYLIIVSIPLTHQQTIKHRSIIITTTKTSSSSRNIHSNYHSTNNFLTLINTFFTTDPQPMQTFHQKVINLIPIFMSEKCTNSKDCNNKYPFECLTNIIKESMFCFRCICWFGCR